MSERRRALACALASLSAAALSACGQSGASAGAAAPEHGAPPASEAAPAAAQEARARGRALYDAHCLICHQPDGSGVPGMQPALFDSDIVASDPDRMIRMALRGVGDGAGALPGSGEYSGAMNSFAHLSDDELSALLSFVRAEWGGGAPPVTPGDIARLRAESQQ